MDTPTRALTPAPVSITQAEFARLARKFGYDEPTINLLLNVPTEFVYLKGVQYRITNWPSTPAPAFTSRMLK